MSQRSVKSLLKNSLVGTDGEIGRCKDVLFCETNWVLRYFVIDTHKWLPFGQKLVISPISVNLEKSNTDTLSVSLTKDQIKGSPPLAEHEPVSREYEKAMFQYYGYGQYWMGPDVWGSYPQPAGLVGGGIDALEEEIESENHLRSVGEIDNYRLRCGEQMIGHVIDFIFDESTWRISHVVVDTQNWPGGRGQHLLPVTEVESVEWSARAVTTHLSPQQLSTLDAP